MGPYWDFWLRLISRYRGISVGLASQCCLLVCDRNFLLLAPVSFLQPAAHAAMTLLLARIWHPQSSSILYFLQKFRVDLVLHITRAFGGKDMLQGPPRKTCHLLIYIFLFGRRCFRHMGIPSAKISIMMNGIRTPKVILVAGLRPLGNARIGEGKGEFVGCDDMIVDDVRNRDVELIGTIELVEIYMLGGVAAVCPALAKLPVEVAISLPSPQVERLM